MCSVHIYMQMQTKLNVTSNIQLLLFNYEIIIKLKHDVVFTNI